MITTHPAYSELKELADKQSVNIHQGLVIARIASTSCSLSISVLRETMDKICVAEGKDTWTEGLKDMHFYPDLHGMYLTVLRSRILHSQPIQAIALLSLIHACGVR